MLQLGVMAHEYTSVLREVPKLAHQLKVTSFWVAYFWSRSDVLFISKQNEQKAITKFI